jgi:uncharacterized YkwD family protein
MKKRSILITVLLLIIISSQVYAQPITYTVQKGDSLWKIAVKYQGQKITVPNIDDVKAQENEVIRLVNVERTKRGLSALKTNWQVSRIARYKSKDMADLNYFSHYSKTYGSPFDMLENFGVKFSAAGENIASGQTTPSQVVTAWMNSPGHRSNILSLSYTQIGVGLAKNKYGKTYWTQMFIKPY